MLWLHLFFQPVCHLPPAPTMSLGLTKLFRFLEHGTPSGRKTLAIRSNLSFSGFISMKKTSLMLRHYAAGWLD